MVEPLGATQLTLDGDSSGDDDDLGQLVDRLNIRLGVAVSRPALVEQTREESRGPAWPSDRPRPLRLLTQPEPIEVMVPVPDDPPVMFRWRGAVHRVTCAEGPERWRGLTGPRDYYRVEDGAGRRYWLFRAGLYHPDRPPPWFLHGLFG